MNNKISSEKKITKKRKNITNDDLNFMIEQDKTLKNVSKYKEVMRSEIATKSNARWKSGETTKKINKLKKELKNIV